MPAATHQPTTPPTTPATTTAPGRMSRGAWTTATRTVTAAVFGTALLAGAVVGVGGPSTSPVQPAAPTTQPQADGSAAGPGPGVGEGDGRRGQFDGAAHDRGGRGER